MTKKYLSETLGISYHAMEEWCKKERNGEDMGNKELHRTARKYKYEELKKIVEENPDITLEKIAEHFRGAISSAYYACQRYKITLKKRTKIQ